jgi:hypothetical protein
MPNRTSLEDIAEMVWVSAVDHVVSGVAVGGLVHGLNRLLSVDINKKLVYKSISRLQRHSDQGPLL